jgi:hypothetical protein
VLDVTVWHPEWKKSGQKSGSTPEQKKQENNDLNIMLKCLMICSSVILTLSKSQVPSQVPLRQYKIVNMQSHLISIIIKLRKKPPAITHRLPRGMPDRFKTLSTKSKTVAEAGLVAAGPGSQSSTSPFPCSKGLVILVAN